jgi:hypothetical protein
MIELQSFIYIINMTANITRTITRIMTSKMTRKITRIITSMITRIMTRVMTGTITRTTDLHKLLILSILSNKVNSYYRFKIDLLCYTNNII